ncbi:MAG: hypothetical protein AAF086_09575, partial [Planctomycetota bacterium]
MNDTVAASYVLDDNAGVNGNAGAFANTRVVLDYNLAVDASIQAAGGAFISFDVNPGDGDDANGNPGNGREFAGVALSDSNANPPYGGAGAITNDSNTTLRYAVLPRNSGSSGNLIRDINGDYQLTATGNPAAGGFNE